MSATMRSFTATVSAQSDDEAAAKIERRLPEGFRVTGRTEWRSERHGLMNVEVENLGGDVDDCWVILTSYGISPSRDLGSTWGDVAGVGR